MMKRVEKWWNDYLTRNKISGVIALEEARKAYRTGLIRGKGEAVYVVMDLLRKGNISTATTNDDVLGMVTEYFNKGVR